RGRGNTREWGRRRPRPRVKMTRFSRTRRGTRLAMTTETVRISPPTGRRIRLQGTVQGVGFRPWVYRVARDTAVTGRVRNVSAGVTIEAFGPPDALDAFVDRLANDATRPAAAVVERLHEEPIAFEEAPAFSIDPSAATVDQRVSIPPDLAACPECLAE